jgi:probable HAF family extracellular repeat protein
MPPRSEEVLNMPLRASVLTMIAAGALSIVRAQTFTSIDYPGATATSAEGINDSGQIAGYYQDGSGAFHGFLYSGGVFSSIDAPFSGAFMTQVLGINNSGQIVGAYHTSFSNIYGFVLSGGVFSPVAYPGATQSGPGAINNNGDMVGSFATAACCVQFGFLYSAGTYTSLDVPPVFDQAAYGINDSGQIAGFYIANNDSTFTQHGFLDSGGAFTPIDFPGATATLAHGINNAGQIVGYWFSGSGPYHGFLDNGALSSIDYPSAAQTAAEGINNLGQIVGYYIDSFGKTHGFLDTPPSAPTVTTTSNITITYSPNGGSVMLAATVTSGAGAVNGGIVTFTVTGIGGPVNSQPVSDGNASASFAIPAGYHTGSFPIQAVYTGAAGFAGSADTSKIFTIVKATPSIAWAAPAAIVFGSALGPAQLNASASVPGAFVYTPPAGTVLGVGNNQTLSATFTPADGADYTDVTATVPITVDPAPPSPGGTAQLTVTRALRRNADESITATVTIANTGSAAAANVELTSARIGAVPATTVLPLSAGTITPGSSAQITVQFPGSAGGTGAATTMALSGTYTGGSYNTTARITLP